MFTPASLVVNNKLCSWLGSSRQQHQCFLLFPSVSQHPGIPASCLLPCIPISLWASPRPDTPGKSAGAIKENEKLMKREQCRAGEPLQQCLMEARAGRRR